MLFISPGALASERVFESLKGCGFGDLGEGPDLGAGFRGFRGLGFKGISNMSGHHVLTCELKPTPKPWIIG